MVKRTGFELFFLLLLLLLPLSFGGCSTLIYMPRGYSDPKYLQLLDDPSVMKISYFLKNDEQTAFYIGPDKHPQKLWLLFGGINSLALDWHQWFVKAAGEDAAFLFVDYPGYGLNQGVPSANLISEASVAAFGALKEFLQLPNEYQQPEVNILGHSLGSGVAVHFASRIKVKKLLLVAPFTNLNELVVYRYGSFLGTLINTIYPEQYHNIKDLTSIAKQHLPPQIIIIHGAEDQVIPAAMSRRMVQMFPDIITYHEIPLTGHRNMFADNLDLILEHMCD